MSKLLLGGILAILVVLLAVMSWAVSPHPPEKPKAPQKTEAEMKKEREEAIKRQTEIMKKEAQGIPQTPPLQVSPTAQQPAPNMPAKPNATNKGPKGMEITSGWMHNRKSGTEGLKQLEERSKEFESKLPPVPMPSPAKQ